MTVDNPCPLALEQVNKVFAFGDVKHPNNASLNREDAYSHNLQKALKHLNAKDKYDHETKLHSLAHVISRFMLALEADLKK